MAKADGAGQHIALVIESWRLAVESVLQTLDWLRTYSDRHRSHSVFYFPIHEGELSLEQEERLWADLLKTRKVIAKQLQDGADILLSQLGEWHKLQLEIMPRLMVARNELTRLRGQGGYKFLWETLSPVAYTMRRWATEFSWEWLSENVALDIELQQAFFAKRESCPWNDSLSYEFREQYRDEYSQLLRDLGTHPPLVDASAKPKPGKKQVPKGREKTYSDDELTRMRNAFDRFRDEYQNDSKKLRGIRSGSMEHFIHWAERITGDYVAIDANEAKRMIDAHRKRFPKPKQRKKKTSR